MTSSYYSNASEDNADSQYKGMFNAGNLYPYSVQTSSGDAEASIATWVRVASVTLDTVIDHTLIGMYLSSENMAVQP